MVTRQFGWAVSLHSILQTVDGGHHWTVTRHITDRGPYLGADLVAIDRRHVWVAASTRVFFTIDGGRRWRVSGPLNADPVPGRGITFGSPAMSFVDLHDGWILTTGGAAAGSAAYSVYRTKNGGATWSRIAYNALLPNQPSRGRLPSCDCLGGISFRDHQAGWVTGSPLAVDTELIFERTADGGVSWSPQALPLPHGFQQFDVSTAPPAFFGAAGILPVGFVRPNAFVLYASGDGGATWHETTPVREPPGSSFADADTFALDPAHVWAWINQALYQTSDGGGHWHRLSQHLAVHGISELQFLTPRIGYMLSEYLGGGGGSPYLLETTNGGRTWRKAQTLLSR
jgi:photosystem II stability/assembly factor-like uncharacterized protein